MNYSIESYGPDNLYLNVGVSDNYNTSNPYPGSRLAAYDQTLTVPILKKPSDYYASIIRFSIPVNTLPLFSFPLNIHQPNPLVSSLIIGIKMGGVLFPVTVNYTTTNNTIPPPVPAPVAPYYTINDLISPFYFIDNIQPFINMINTALAQAVTNSAIGVTAPYYVYSAQTQLFSLIVTQTFIATGALVFLNYPLKVFINSFNFTTEQARGTYGAIRFFHDLSVLPYDSPAGGPYKFDQEWNSLDLWFDIRKIVITTTLPIAQEANPLTIDATSSSGNPTATYLPIFTDFVVAYNNINDVSSIITYNPTAQYRLADMTSDHALSRISLNFYWQTKTGSLQPIFISPRQSLTVKIGFFKRSLFKFVDRPFNGQAQRDLNHNDRWLTDG